MSHSLLFVQEYYSFAHCVAGGCASIATSFIFTPSERIKQQMQVGTKYHNCWYILKILVLSSNTTTHVVLLGSSGPYLYI